MTVMYVLGLGPFFFLMFTVILQRSVLVAQLKQNIQAQQLLIMQLTQEFGGLDIGIDNTSNELMDDWIDSEEIESSNAVPAGVDTDLGLF